MTTVVDMGARASHSFDFDLDGSMEFTPLKTIGGETAIYERLVGGTIVSRAGNQGEFNRIASEMVDHGCLFTL
ncbi:MAG: hypothetical protein JOZ69_00745, partial [Myxococcales bacterium]|nr:hypothetical protein [Myxococcales bacterium]